jgi:hypothetical protein
MENVIDLPGFRKLLQVLENDHTSIRLRLLGETWTGFGRVILLSESAVILQDDSERRMIINIRNVIEFELDNALPGLVANVPYEIVH